MKKIITLLFSVGVFTTSFAQYNRHRNSEDKNYGSENHWNDRYANSSKGNRNHDRDHKYGRSSGNNYSAQERNFQVEKINRDFNFRIRAIQNDRYLRRRQKKAAIREAEAERSRQLQIVYERFNSANHW